MKGEETAGLVLSQSGQSFESVCSINKGRGAGRYCALENLPEKRDLIRKASTVT